MRQTKKSQNQIHLQYQSLPPSPKAVEVGETGAGRENFFELV